MRSLLLTAVLLCRVAAELPPLYPSIAMRGISGNVPMPLVGLGTWQYNSSRAQAAVAKAMKIGYRHVDTAAVYGNQVGVGAALRSSGLERQEYFVTTKIPGGLNRSATAAAADECLKELGLDYVDLMLIHFPASFDGKAGGAALRREEWLALEEWAKSGKARAIGVSHYCQAQLEDILAINTVPVALNQVEYHIGMGSATGDATDDKEFCQRQGIVYMSFSTLCGPCPAPYNTTLITGKMVSEIGKAHGKKGTQVALRWAVQQGIPVVPKSDKEHHLREDLALFDFELTEQEVQRLTAATEPPVTGGGDCRVKELMV
mmetsp:Transcript_89658/g.253976  ORF Transcript_89658/g.253976 Transcript_89658/m.253976 type:complete len:317 (+) Transcript_89658:61-1011(+)